MATPAKRKRQLIELPEAGLPEVYVQTLKISEQEAVFAIESDRQRGLRILALAVVDAEGKTVWSEDDWDIFAGSDQVRFHELAMKPFELSGIRDESKKVEAPD